MSLFEMSANVQKTANLKRCHDDFTSDDAVKPEREVLKQGSLRAGSIATEQREYTFSCLLSLVIRY